MSEKLEEFDNRIIFAKTLIALANEDPKVVVVCNDSVGSSNLTEFRDLFPDRLIDVGIAEQNYRKILRKRNTLLDLKPSQQEK